MNPSATPTPLAHLTEDQLDEVLLDFAEPAVAAHAAACPLCSSRLEEFRSSLAAFNQASEQWSQARSNTLPRDLPSGQVRHVFAPATLWSYASAGLVAVVLLVTVAMHRHATAPPPTAPASNYALSHQAEIANDNAMLAAISSALNRPDPIPASLDDDLEVPQPGPSRLRQERD